MGKDRLCLQPNNLEQNVYQCVICLAKDVAGREPRLDYTRPRPRHRGTLKAGKRARRDKVIRDNSIRDKAIRDKAATDKPILGKTT